MGGIEILAVGQKARLAHRGGTTLPGQKIVMVAMIMHTTLRQQQLTVRNHNHRSIDLVPKQINNCGCHCTAPPAI